MGSWKPATRPKWTKAWEKKQTKNERQHQPGDRSFVFVNFQNLRPHSNYDWYFHSQWYISSFTSFGGENNSIYRGEIGPVTFWAGQKRPVFFLGARKEPSLFQALSVLRCSLDSAVSCSRENPKGFCFNWYAKLPYCVCIYVLHVYIPVVPHKAVAEVSRIGNV